MGNNGIYRRSKRVARSRVINALINALNNLSSSKRSVCPLEAVIKKAEKVGKPKKPSFEPEAARAEGELDKKTRRSIRLCHLAPCSHRNSCFSLAVFILWISRSTCTYSKIPECRSTGLCLDGINRASRCRKKHESTITKDEVSGPF